MYRNIYYNNHKGTITLWTWNDQGDRTEYETPFKPYIYIESQNSKDAVSIYNTPLRKIEFKNQYERRKYLETCGIKRIFHNINVEQQYLLEQFGTISTTPEFTQHPLRVVFLDIEAVSKTSFPNPTEAKHPINLITIYDSLEKQFYTWGLQKDYKSKNENSIYIKCYSEEDLLKKFLGYWTNDYPDIMTGWNIEGFDTPYLINRITNILGEDYAKQLSPVHELYKRDGVIKRFGKAETKWYIKGVSLLDYMEVYKTFSRDPQESYSLDYIAEVELDEKKLEIEMSLADLAEQDWETFTDYNIQDVNLLLRLENKLKFLELIRTFAYLGLTPFESALGTVSVVTGAMSVKAEESGMKIATFNNANQPNYEGGYVREPERGLKEAILSYDANSLYPNTIITLNISPETKVGKILDATDKEVEFKLISGKEYTLPVKKFYEFIKKENIAISKARILYSQKTKGICPKLVDGLYQDRLKLQKQLKEHETAILHCKKGSEKYSEHKKMIEYLSMSEQIGKITINRIYGAFATPHSPFCDIDAASSITLTGQACIKQATELVNKHVKTKYSLMEPVDIYGDTDSLVGDTLIRTTEGIVKISDLYEICDQNKKETTNYGHELVEPKQQISCLTYDSKDKKAKYGKIKRVVRHKVSKKKYKIKCGGKEIIMTEDHGCMVLRDGNLIQISPKNIKLGDKMVNIYTDTEKERGMSI